MRRSLLNISQEKLAECVGLTFQQIQKYERGTNRVSASRLFQIGKILDVPVNYFYQEYQDGKSKAPRAGLADNDQEALISDDILYSKESIDLLKTYYALDDEKKRKELQKILRSMIENMQSST